MCLLCDCVIVVWCNSSLISENCLYRDIITKWAFGAGLKFLRWRGACSFCKHFQSQFNWMTSDSSSFQWENQSLHFLFCICHVYVSLQLLAVQCFQLPSFSDMYHTESYIQAMLQSLASVSPSLLWNLTYIPTHSRETRGYLIMQSSYWSLALK